MSCGFTAMTTMPAPAAASTFESVVSMPCRSDELGEPLLVPRRRRDLGRLAPARGEEARDEGLAGLSGSEDGNLPARHG